MLARSSWPCPLATPPERSTIWRPQLLNALADYRCQDIWQVALGVRKREMPSTLPTSSSLGFSCLHSTDQPGRVSDRDHLLIQVTLPAAAGRQPEDIVRLVTNRLGISADPVVWRALATEEAVSIHDQDHPGNMRQLRALLPDGIALVGSDYLLSAAATARSGATRAAHSSRTSGG